MNRREYFDHYLSTHFARNAVLDVKRDKLEFDTFDRNFRHLLPADKSISILEIGFGTGFFLKYLIANGYENVYGIELSSEETDFVKEHITPNVECIDSTEEYLKSHQNKYDIVVMLDVLEHIPKANTVDLLRNIRTSLTKEGMFIARVPNGSNPLNVQMFVCDFTHEFIFSSESLKQVLSLAKFSTINVYPFKEEGLTLHGKITNMTQRAMFSLLKLAIGLNRSYRNNDSFYTRTIYCAGRK